MIREREEKVSDKKRIVYVLVSLLIIVVIGGVWLLQRPERYQNPIFGPTFADPSIIKGDDGYFYAYGTEDDWGDGHGPHLIPIIRSKDLIHWEFYRDAFTEKPVWKEGGGGLWAPDISRHQDGTYYLYYAFSVWGDPNPAIGVATATKPGGPFTDHGPLFTSESIGVDNSIDPQFFQDEDGKSYLFWGSFHGIYGIQLADDRLHTIGQKFQIADTSYEAPYIIKRDGFYYLFVSAGTCCDGENSTYHVKVGRSKSVKGPYKDQKGIPLLEGGGTVILAFNGEPGKNSKQFVGPGHNAIITDDQGNDWIIYHAINEDDPRLLNGATKRPLMIDRMIWKDGWPTVKNQEPSTDLTEGPDVK